MKLRRGGAAVLPSPFRLFLIAVATLFLAEFVAETGVESFLPLMLPGGTRLTQALLNAVLQTLLIAPILWAVAMRPLRRIAMENRQAAIILAHAGDGILTLDAQGRLVAVNPAAERLFGYREGEVVGQPMTLLLPERDRDTHLRQLEQIRSGDEARILEKASELHGLMKDGREFPLELSLATWKVGTEAFFTGIVRDITARKHAEEALRQSEEKYRQLFATGPDAIIILDADTRRLVDVNESALHLYGYLRDEFLQLTHADITGEPAESERSIQRVLGEERRKMTHQYHRKKDGTVFPVEISTGTFMLRGRRVVCGIVRDSTERKRFEALQDAHEALRILIQASPLAVVALDPEGNVTLWNPAAERIFGWPEDEVVGHAPPTVPARKGEEFRALRERVLKGESLAGVEVRRQKKDGSPVDIGIWSAALHDTHDRITGMMAIVADITERKQIEERLRLQSTALEAAENSILITDREGRILWVNPAFTRQTGYSPEEILGQNPRLLKSGEHDQAFYQNLWGTILSGQVWRGEMVNRRKDGSLHTEEDTITPVRDERGEITHIIAIRQDTTDRKRAEQALRESEEKYRSLVESTSDWVWEVDERAVYTYASPRVREILGYTPEEVLGKTPFDLMPAEEAKKVADVFAPIRAAMEPFVLLENVNLHKDGHPVALESSGVPVFDRQGGFRGYRGVDRDVSSRKRTEEALRAHTQQLEAVRTVSAEITRELNLPMLLKIINRRAAELVGASASTIRLWDEGTQTLIPAAWHGVGDWVGAVRFELGQGVGGVVAQRREGMIVNDYRTSPYALPVFLERTGINAVLSEPLLYRDKLLGIITLNTGETGRIFTPQHRETLALFAAHAAIAIENARLYGEAMGQRKEAEILADLARKVTASLDLDTVLQQVVEGARELSRSDMAEIALRRVGSGGLAFRYLAGARCAKRPTLTIQPGKGLGGKILVTGEPFRTHNYAEDPRFTKDYLPLVQAEGVIAELGVPIQIENRVEGVLFVGNRSPRSFSTYDETIMMRLADLAAIALKNAQLYGRAQEEIAERKRTEEEVRGTTQMLRAVMTAAPVAVVSLDPEGMVRVWNPAAERMFGWSEQEVLGCRYPLVPVEEEWGEFRAKLARDLEGMLQSDEDVQRQRKDGSRVVVRVSTAPLRDASGAVCGLISALMDITARKQVEELHSRLLERMIEEQEKDRERLARELHDETGQALSSLLAHLQALGVATSLEDVRAQVAVVRELLARSMQEVRRQVKALRPAVLDDLGLIAALEQLAKQNSTAGGLYVDFCSLGLDGVRLPTHLEVAIFRIVQEAMTNVIKHAQARRASVLLERRGDLIIAIVEDDGYGFDVGEPSGTEGPGLGLLGIRERASMLGGTLTVESSPDRGTTLTVEIPLGSP